jgi:hypothetical protein
MQLAQKSWVSGFLFLAQKSWVSGFLFLDFSRLELAERGLQEDVRGIGVVGE